MGKKKYMNDAMGTGVLQGPEPEVEAMGPEGPMSTTEALGAEQLQEETDNYIVKAMEILHGKETRAPLFKMLLSNPDPVESMSDTIVMIFQRIDTAVANEGLQISDMVRLNAAVELTDQVIELAVASNKLEEPEEEDRALILAVSVEKYIKAEIEAGRIDPQALATEMEAAFQSMPPEAKQVMIDQMDDINNTVKKRAPNVSRIIPGDQQGPQGPQVPQEATEGPQEDAQVPSALGGM